jgi:transposase
VRARWVTWVNTVGGEKVVPLINLMNEALFSVSYLHIDETPLQVLRSGKAVGAEHYIVVRAGGCTGATGPPGRRIILYDYIASRTKVALKQLLIGADGPYRGKLISDGLERYDEIAAELNLLHFGCLQHCRSMFFKARKVSQLPSSRTLANVAIETYIRQVYQVESEIRALQARRADSFTLAESPNRQFALREARQYLAPSIRTLPYPYDLLHCSLQWCDLERHCPRRYARE